MAKPVTEEQRIKQRARCKAYRIANKQRVSEYNKAYYIAMRTEVLMHYSNGEMCCACCGERRYEFLSLDHINGGGNKHRGNVGTRAVFADIRKENFPPGYQVLCHNCNMAKAFYKACPHWKEKLAKEQFGESD